MSRPHVNPTLGTFVYLGRGAAFGLVASEPVSELGYETAVGASGIDDAPESDGGSEMGASGMSASGMSASGVDAPSASEPAVPGLVVAYVVAYASEVDVVRMHNPWSSLHPSWR